MVILNEVSTGSDSHLVSTVASGEMTKAGRIAPVLTSSCSSVRCRISAMARADHLAPDCKCFESPQLPEPVSKLKIEDDLLTINEASNSRANTEPGAVATGC